MKIESNISHISANTIIQISPCMHLCVNIKIQLQLVNDKSDMECLVELVTPPTNPTPFLVSFLIIRISNEKVRREHNSRIS